MAKKNSDARARFAQRLRAIRIPRGFKTARSFATALDIDENRYTRYERAEVEPDLQLLMKMCSLLGATPNDLLCDTIGAQPLDVELPYGFSEQPVGSFHSSALASAPQQQHPSSRLPGASPADRLDTRKAIGFQLAELIATVEARASGVAIDNWEPLEKLRLTVPIAAMIEGGAFQFIADLPDRLEQITVSNEEQAKIELLIKELIIAHKPVANDNS